MIHAGSTLVVGPPDRLRTAAVTCLLTLRGSAVPTHLVTAGHSFSRDTDARVVHAVTGIGDTPRPVGRLVLNLLDRAAPDEPAVDAALIALDVGAPFSGPGRGAGFLATASAARGAVVHPWLPSRNGVAGAHRLGPPIAEGRFRSPIRDEGFLLRDLLAIAPPLTLRGDSGAPLLDRHGRGVGLLVGRLGQRSVFQRLPEALTALRETTDLPLHLAGFRPAG